MKKTRKMLAMLLSMMLVAVVAIGGTYAYLTADTGVVTNTFTVGSVSIDLDEAKVDLYGVKDTAANRVKANDYKLIPGHTYVKDPTVTVAGGSEACYVRMFVEFTNSDKLDEVFPNADLTTIFNNVSTKWEYKNNVENEADKTRTYEFWYKGIVPASKSDTVLEALFGSFTIPGTVGNDNLAKLDGTEINVTANAIQADGFATADLAWAQWGK